LFALDNTVVSDVQPKLAVEFPDGISKIACMCLQTPSQPTSCEGANGL
jgi:hypothetical protein